MKSITIKPTAIIIGIISIFLLIIVAWLLYTTTNINLYVKDSEVIIIQDEEVYY